MKKIIIALFAIALMAGCNKDVITPAPTGAVQLHDALRKHAQTIPATVVNSVPADSCTTISVTHVVYIYECAFVPVTGSVDYAVYGYKDNDSTSYSQLGYYVASLGNYVGVWQGLIVYVPNSVTTYHCRLLSYDAATVLCNQKFEFISTSYNP